VDATLASAAIPAVFPPVTVEGTPQWDGGIADNAALLAFLGGPEVAIVDHAAAGGYDVVVTAQLWPRGGVAANTARSRSIAWIDEP
jgi:predicted acylesterase/phospholipase RssA